MSVLYDIFPHLKSTVLEVGYDNGMINRPQDWLERIAPILETKPFMSLNRANLWLSTLTEEQRGTLAAGEASEMEALVATNEIGPFVHSLLNEVFNNG